LACAKLESDKSSKKRTTATCVPEEEEKQFLCLFFAGITRYQKAELRHWKRSLGGKKLSVESKFMRVREGKKKLCLKYRKKAQVHILSVG
jgi:hypothetical protein